MRLTMLTGCGPAAFLFLAGCSDPPGLPAGTYDHFQAFKRAPMHRAYALARAANGSYSAVFVGNHPSAEAAEAAAMTQCQDYAGRRLYADPSSCRVYAVDDTILGTGRKIAPAAPGG